MAISRQARGVLFVAAAMDVALGLMFLAYGAALFGLEAGIALIIGLVLIGSGISLFVFAIVIGRGGPGGRGPSGRGGGVIDRR